ncbi:MAG TPA: hypothetical protein VKZ53_09540 [Candidatus Angelobacter sp.]|nr:hypothetical protein [Candidatus Angelobacter sp.]
MRFDRLDLEKFRGDKQSSHFFRLVSPMAVQHEFCRQFGHPSSYAFVRLECVPADDLSFEVRALWPLTVSKEERMECERAIAESIGDMLLDGPYPHSGCALALVEVGYDAIGSSVYAFMQAARSALQDLLAAKWNLVPLP